MGYLIGIFFLFLTGTFALSYGRELLLDELFCLLAVDAMFFLTWIVALMKKRLGGELVGGRSNSYGKLFLLLLLSWICEIAFSYLPEFFAPMMLLGVLLTTVLDEMLALSFGLYFIIVQCMTCGFSVTVLYCYCIVSILGILLSGYLKQKKTTGYLCIYILYFLINIVVPVIFYYLTYLEIQAKTFLYSIFTGLINCVVVMLFYRPLYERTQMEEVINYGWFLEESFPLVKEIKKFSTAEYNHAKKVSKLSGVCAREIGVNAACAACGGFYYRLGKIEGEPEIDNALRVANNYCFPGDVMDILEEYGGILRLPQTPESAIVHMVDTLVTKIELLDRDTMSSTWNQDMVIYQTLNDLSQKGFYDEAKMSMNQFLKIREKLVQEESLL